MKRGGPLRRGKPLERGTSQLKRTPLRRGSKRLRRRKTGFSAAQKREIHERDGWQCRATIRHVCSGRADHAHHVWPLGRGGPNVVENGLSVCWAGHRAIHDHSAEAERLGLLVSAPRR